jgi:hypothetical protein
MRIMFLEPLTYQDADQSAANWGAAEHHKGTRAEGKLRHKVTRTEYNCKLKQLIKDGPGRKRPRSIELAKRNPTNKHCTTGYVFIFVCFFV